jgi:hypothetical protein
MTQQMETKPPDPIIIANCNTELTLIAIACPRINLNEAVDCKNIEPLQKSRDSLFKDGLRSEYVFQTPIIGWAIQNADVMPIAPGLGGNDPAELEDVIWSVSQNGACFSSFSRTESMESFIQRAISIIETRISELLDLICT